MQRKTTIEIESKDEEIFFGFDSDVEVVVLKDCQVVVEELFQKEEAIKKVDKDPIGDHCGDEEGFEQELSNEEIESINPLNASVALI